MREPPVTGAKAIAERVARSLADQGARAVALVGSYARGDATAESDVDLAVIGDGPHYRLELHDGLLVSLGWATAEEQRRRLYDPAYLGTHVPGWRTAIAVYDPEALAAATRQEARDWVWGLVEDAHAPIVVHCAGRTRSIAWSDDSCATSHQMPVET